MDTDQIVTALVAINQGLIAKLGAAPKRPATLIVHPQGRYEITLYDSEGFAPIATFTRTEPQVALIAARDFVQEMETKLDQKTAVWAKELEEQIREAQDLSLPQEVVDELKAVIRTIRGLG